MRNSWEKHLPLPQMDPEVFCLTVKWFINDPVQIIILYPPFLFHLLLVGTHRTDTVGKQMNLVCPVSQAPQAPSSGLCTASQERCSRRSFCSHAGGLPKSGRGELTNTTGHKWWEGQQLLLQQSFSHDPVPSCYS